MTRSYDDDEPRDEAPPFMFGATGALVDVAEMTLSGITRFRNGLVEQGVAPDFRDQMTADFARHVYALMSAARAEAIVAAAAATNTSPLVSYVASLLVSPGGDG